MMPLTERLVLARYRNDNITSIIRARFKGKSKLEKIFLLEASLEDSQVLKSSTKISEKVSAITISGSLTKYLQGILNGN